MSNTYHLDGMVVRDQDNRYVCEIIAYENTLLTELLNAPEVLELVKVDRDIKAANLQLLVDAVLAADLLNLSTGRDISLLDERTERASLLRLVNLARGLKQ